MRTLKKIVLLFLFAVWGCAVQAPPSGGPVDRIPPEITGTDPMPGTLHVPTSFKRLKIVFSERMKESTARNNLFISPPLKFQTKWKKGRILIIDFEEALKDSQTYVLSVGSGLQDMHNNKMARSFTLAFSTGDTIDQGKITGTIYGLKRGETFYVFAYLLGDSTRFNPFKNKPDYVTLNGEKGDFTLGYLKNGTYRVIAVEDRNHNLRLDGLMERFALSFRDVTLYDSLNHFDGLDMQLATLDTLPPTLTGARALLRNLLVVRFSEPLLLDRLTNFEITDSLGGQKLPIVDMAPSPKKKNWLEMITAPMDSNRLYRVRCINLIDSAGNRNSDTLTTYFVASSKTDTSTFRLIKHLPTDSAKKVAPRTAITLEFNQPVNWRKVEKAYRLQRDSRHTIDGSWQVKNLYRAYFYPSKVLHPDSGYYSVVNLKAIKSYFGKTSADSVSRHFFTIISQKELGEISGNIRVRYPLQNPVVLNVRRISGKRFRVRQTIKKGKHTFKFDYLPQGSYRLDGFLDLNQNNRFDHGTILPFRFCEPFRYLPDTIKVRKRWETSGVLFTLPQPMESGK